MPAEQLREMSDGRSIPLGKVPQIPADVARTIEIMGEFALTDEQMERASAAIWEATQEIDRRILAQKMGVRLEEHFDYTPDQAHARAMGKINAKLRAEREAELEDAEV